MSNTKLSDTFYPEKTVLGLLDEMKDPVGENDKDVEIKVIYSIVVPLFNEELVIKESYMRLKNIMDGVNESYEIVFVNDGSKDKTKELVDEICAQDESIRLINFSRNFGHQAAITAGMVEASGAAIVVIDADMQDPPEIIPLMIEKWKQGFEVVYGKRTKREGETFFKKWTAKIFYRIINHLTTIEIPCDTGDFRLIDRKVCDTLNQLPEKNRYIRGLISWLGFRQTSVEFIRQERFAGESKYPIKKMMKLALDGIISFSYKPLTFFGYFGGALILIGFISFVVVLINNMLGSVEAMSLSFFLTIIVMLFGITLTALGVMGQYICRILDESKNRPNYIIDDEVHYKKK